MRSICAVLALSLSLVTSAARAVVLWDQPLDYWETGWCSPCHGDSSQYDRRAFGSFNLANNSILQSGMFGISESDQVHGDLNISIWDVPNGTELYSIDVSSGSYTTIPSFSTRYYYAIVDLPNWSLPGGSYWASLFGINGNHLGWASDLREGDDAVYTFVGSKTPFSIYVGFSLSGVVVPEPGSLTLLGLGLAGLGFMRRRL